MTTDSSRGQSFRAILRATSITGAASVATVLLGMIRTKALAVMLGPAGIGIIGIYSSIVSSAAALAGLGLNGSGVRQIAEAYGSHNSQAISDTRTALRHATILLGLFGGAVLAGGSGFVSRVVFGSAEQSWQVAFLGCAVVCTVFATSQTAFLNGLRRIRELALCNVHAALWGTGISILLVVFLGERGILPVVVGLSAVTVCASTWYVAGIPRAGERATWPGQISQVARLLRLGVVFMASGFMANGVLLLVRRIVLQELGVDATGHFQAAWGLAITYVGFILSAMGTDYYPRLTGIIADKEEAARLVNDQTEVALLMAGPILLGMYALAPQIIAVLYSAGFEPAVSVFRWQLIGNLFKVAAFPIGFVMMAKGAGGTFFASEMAWNVLFLTSVWYLAPRIGLDATGVSFALGYAACLLWISCVVWRMIGFRFRRRIVLLFMGNLVLLGSVQLLLPWHEGLAVAWGLIAAGFSGLASIRILLAEAAPTAVARIANRLASALGSRGGRRGG
jgi:O-antigen/teichoic acid export membrane protein